MQKKNHLIKVLALLFMIIDHVGYLINNNLFRLVGRLSFPLFVYLLVEGYHRTRSKKKYFFRMLVFYLISQPFYMLYFDTLRNNIFATLTIGLIMMYIIENYSFVYLVPILVLVPILNVDYGLYGVLTILIFYYFRENLKLRFVLFVILTLVYSLNTGFYIQMFSILALFIVLLENSLSLTLSLNKYVFYFVYPGHLLLLFLLKKL